MTDAAAVTRHCLVILAVIASGVALYVLRDILTPLALALFLSIMIDGFARVLSERAKVPLRIALPLAILLSVLLFGGAIYVIADNGAGFVSQMGAYGPRLDAVIGKTAHLLGVAVPPTIGQLINELNPSRFIGPIAQGLQGFAANAVFVLIYMGFLIASRHAFKRKLASLFPDRERRSNAIHVFQHIRNGVEQYLWIQTVTGLMIAVGAWIVMVGVGLDNAVFWAFLIFIVCYIPVVGGAIAVLLPPLFALVQFDTFMPAIILFAALNAINFIVGNIVLPRMQGETLNLDAVVVLFSLAFWTVIWGLPGAFLSTPLTVTAMVVLAQFPNSRWIAVLLSGNGDPQSSGEKPVAEPHAEEKTPPSRKRDGSRVKPKRRSPI
jgi:predicted PurR-regulated permease PerM